VELILLEVCLVFLKFYLFFKFQESCSNEGEFALSVRSNTDKVVHVRISHKNGRFCIVPKDNFRTLAGLVENYIRLPMVQVCSFNLFFFKFCLEWWQCCKTQNSTPFNQIYRCHNWWSYRLFIETIKEAWG